MSPTDESPTSPAEGGGGGAKDGGSGGTFDSLPSWLPWAVYAIATLVLFREFVVSDRMLLGTDTLSLGYVARDFFARWLDEGVFPLWNPLILGGTPFLESLAGGDSLYPPSLLLLYLSETYRALGWKLILHVFVAGLFTYAWIRTLGCSRSAALLGGLAYLVAPFMVTLVYPGHDGKIFVTALTPLLFWATERGFAGGRKTGAGEGAGNAEHGAGAPPAADGFGGVAILAWVAVAVVVGLVILTTHFQMAYFLFGAVGLYALFRSAQLWRSVGPGVALRKMGLFLVAALVGAGLSGVQLLPAVEYVTESSRRTATTVQADEVGSVAYSSSWSLHPEELAGLVIPEFVGSNAGGAEWTTNTYWGRNPFKLNHEYAGIVVLFLAGLAFFGKRPGRPGERGVEYFLAGLGVFSLLYTLGGHTPVWRILYEVVPGVSLFRAPSTAVFVFGFAAVTLAALGFDRAVDLAREASDDAWRSLSRYVLAFVGFLALVTVLATTGLLDGLWSAIFYRSMDQGQAQVLSTAMPHVVRGGFLAVVLTGITGAALWAHRRERLGPVGLVVAVAAVLFLDGVRVDDPFIRTFDFHGWIAPTANIRFLQERQASEPPFRVLSMVQGGQDVKPAAYGLALAAGHHPNDLARYRELIGMVGSGVPQNLLQSQALMRVLNVRYLLWPDAQYGPVEGMPRVSLVEGPGGAVLESVYEIPGLPRARLVGAARVVPESEAVETLLSADFDVEDEVVLAESPPIELPGTPVEGEVEWLERTPNRLVLGARSDQPSLLVLAENWFPAWKARVDGEEVPVLRANHTLRAIPLDAGDHRIEVYYDSASLAWSFRLSVGMAVLLLLVTGAALWRDRTKA